MHTRIFLKLICILILAGLSLPKVVLSGQSQLAQKTLPQIIPTFFLSSSDKNAPTSEDLVLWTKNLSAITLASFDLIKVGFEEGKIKFSTHTNILKILKAQGKKVFVDLSPTWDVDKNHNEQYLVYKNQENLKKLVVELSKLPIDGIILDEFGLFGRELIYNKKYFNELIEGAKRINSEIIFILTEVSHVIVREILDLGIHIDVVSLELYFGDGIDSIENCKKIEDKYHISCALWANPATLHMVPELLKQGRSVFIWNVCHNFTSCPYDEFFQTYKVNKSKFLTPKSLVNQLEFVLGGVGLQDFLSENNIKSTHEKNTEKLVSNEVDSVKYSFWQLSEYKALLSRIEKDSEYNVDKLLRLLRDKYAWGMFKKWYEGSENPELLMIENVLLKEAIKQQSNNVLLKLLSLDLIVEDNALLYYFGQIKNIDKKVVTKLLEQGADIHAITPQGESVLVLAIIKNRLDVLKLLISRLSFQTEKKIKNLNFIRSTVENIKASAFVYQDFETSYKPVEPLGYDYRFYNLTPLAAAFAVGNVEMVEYLLSLDSHLNQDLLYTGPLFHSAVLQANETLARICLDNGCDPLTVNPYNQNVLQKALQTDNMDAIHLIKKLNLYDELL